MAFGRAKKKREPLGEAALFEYAVGALARKMPYVSSGVMTVLGVVVLVQGARHLMH